MIRIQWAFAILTAGLLAGCTESTPSSGNVADPKVQPKLRLVAKKDTYDLNLAGLSPEDAEKQFQAKKPTQTRPPFPQVDLSLELHNPGSNEVIIPIGTRDWYTLEVEGPGAVQAQQHAMWCIPTPDIVVKGGKSHQVPLRQMAYFRDGGTKAWCWTRPGAYTVTAHAQVKVQGRLVTVRSNSIKLNVQAGQNTPLVPEEPVIKNTKADWKKLFADIRWYKNAKGKEQVFRGKLQAVPNAGGPSTLQRTSYYKLGDRTIYTGAKKLKVLDQLVGKQVEIRGKPVDMKLEGQSLKEIWPAAIRLRR